MIHDPLCPWAQDDPLGSRAECFLIEGSEPPMTACELIGRVRSDAVDGARSAVVAVASAGLPPTVPYRMFVHTSSVLAAIDALRGEL